MKKKTENISNKREKNRLMKEPKIPFSFLFIIKQWNKLDHIYNKIE